MIYTRVLIDVHGVYSINTHLYSIYTLVYSIYTLV